MTVKIVQDKTIGLTGGIACGKSTVATYLAATYALPILDADTIARAVVQPKTLVLEKIKARYGITICQANGELNRQKLGDIIFHHPAERQWVEAQIHPLVRLRLKQQANALRETEPWLVMMIPLLFEAKMTDLVGPIWVVTAPESIQIQRLMARNHLTLDQAQARIHSQLPLAAKIAQADVVLSNDGDLPHLTDQIDQAWHALLLSVR